MWQPGVSCWPLPSSWPASAGGSPDSARAEARRKPIDPMAKSGGRGRSWGELWEHFGVILKVWVGFRSQVHLGKRLGRLLADFKGQDDSILRPKRVPSCSQNGTKIDRNIDGFGNRFLNGFSSILGGEMKASWNQNGIQIRSYLENAVKQKVLLKPIEFQ